MLVYSFEEVTHNRKMVTCSSLALKVDGLFYLNWVGAVASKTEELQLVKKNLDSDILF